MVHLVHLEDVVELDEGAVEDLRVMPRWVSYRKMTNAMRKLPEYFASTVQAQCRIQCCSFAMGKTGRSVNAYDWCVKGMCCYSLYSQTTLAALSVHVYSASL